MNPQIVETVNVAREVAWLPWAVQYFFLIGISYGSFLLSLPGLVWRKPQWKSISHLALAGALICGLSAPVALLADLHQPGRFLNFYLHFNPSSWMAWGAWFIPIYVGGLLLYSWLAWRPMLAQHGRDGGRYARLAGLLAYGGHESPSALKMAALITAVGAVLVALYTGAEVMVVAARPLWNTPWLPVQFVVTALAGALGMVLLFNRMLSSPDRRTVRTVSRLLAWTQLLALFVGASWLLLGLSGWSEVHSMALAQVAPADNWRLLAVWAVLATVVTFLLAWKRPGSGLLIGLLALHSTWMMRWSIFMGGQEVPKTGAGYYSYQLPMGPEGLLGIIGTLGLWVFLFIALTSLLPLNRLAGSESH